MEVVLHSMHPLLVTAMHVARWRLVVDPADYEQLLGSLASGSGPDAQMRARLAWKAFQHTATYDATVAEWLWSQIGAALPLPSQCVGLEVTDRVPVHVACGSATGQPVSSTCTAGDPHLGTLAPVSLVIL